jgi:hypothetical protein
MKKHTKNVRTVTLVDVPSGWVYGFPKEINEAQMRDVKKFVVDNGYPKEMTEEGWFYTRFIQKDVYTDDIDADI